MSLLCLRNKIVVVVLLALCLDCEPARAQTKKIFYHPSDAVIQNPERGLYWPEETGMSRGKITPYTLLDPARLRELRQDHTLLFRYFGLKQWRTTDLPDTILRLIDKDFALIREAGFKCIPRFTYSADIGEPDAPLNITLRHIHQLKPLLQKNKDVIAVMQAGFIGAWGEWHSSTSGNDTPAAARQILLKILEALPKDRMVQVRSPRRKQDIFSLQPGAALTPAQAFSGIPIARVGHHNDCFLADESDKGTYMREGKLDTATAKAYLQLDTRFVPMGGETCLASEFSRCPNALQEMRRLHWVFLNDSYDEVVLDNFLREGCKEEMKRRLGYRFMFLNSESRTSVSPGGAFPLSVTLTNCGWASLYNPRPVELIFRNMSDGSSYSVRLPDDPRRWQSGDTITVNATVGIPETIAQGKYSVYLNLPDASPSLLHRPEYSVQFANEHTWEPISGYNLIADSVVIGSSPDMRRYQGFRWLKKRNGD